MTTVFCLTFTLIYSLGINANDSLNYERSYDLFREQITRQGRIDLLRVPYIDELQNENSPALEALWNSLWDTKNEFEKMMAISSLKRVDYKRFSVNDQLYIHILKKEFFGQISTEFFHQLQKEDLTVPTLYIIFGYEKFFTQDFNKRIQEKYFQLNKKFEQIY